MASVTVWNKYAFGYRFAVQEPIRAYALSHLAASGMFSKIVIEKDDGTKMEIDADGIMACADVVGPVKREEQ